MAFVLNDRVKETSTTTGTGSIALSGHLLVSKLLLQVLVILIQRIMQ